ncbi:MAG: hypothetical protein ACYTG1_02150 [Planctomycetota bacterium]|jgi:hypothetical protein
MLDSLRRNAVFIVGLVVCGLVCSRAAAFMTSPRGAAGPTILHAESWPAALVAVAACLAVATAVAVVVARVINTAVGLFVLGAGVYILAARLSTVQEIAHGGGSPGLLVVELAIWSALLLAAAGTVFGAGGPLLDIHPEPGRPAPSPWLSRQALTAAAAGLLVLPVVWLIAQSTMKGQVVGAVFVGGLLAGLVGRLLAPHVQPVLVFAAPCVFGMAGYLLGMSMLDTSFREAYVAGTLPALLRPMPVDYAAGSLAGVAVGLGCARSFLHHQEDETGAAATPA